MKILFAKTAILVLQTTIKTAEADIKRMLGKVQKPLTKYFQAAAGGTRFYSLSLEMLNYCALSAIWETDLSSFFSEEKLANYSL